MWCTRCDCHVSPMPDPAKDTVRVDFSHLLQGAGGGTVEVDGDAQYDSYNAYDRTREMAPRSPARPVEQSDAPAPEECGALQKAVPATLGQSDVLKHLRHVADNWLGHLKDISLEYEYSDLAIATGNFSKSSLLGSGAAGTVYRGATGGGTEVAIKVLVDQGGLEGFEEEVRLLSKIRHPNVVTLFGWGRQGRNRYLVYELLPGGDVENKLRKCKEEKSPFPWDQRLRVALDSARGLSHMVNLALTVFHRDIKPANILLDSDGTAKIADFGLAGTVGDIDDAHMSVGNISGTPGYACPHYIQTGHVSEKSEIYSFGMVLLELLLNQPPALSSPEGDLIYPLLQAVQPAAPGAHSRLLAQLDRRANWPSAVAEELADLTLALIDVVQDRRPTFEHTTLELQRLTTCGPDQRQDEREAPRTSFGR
mmetsp:Transcript_840/g.2112  ORF Transcript_840/g.2112 Transcript_840/m.2112 type:complete len:423 (+) Transcript_840:111-1379(+)